MKIPLSVPAIDEKEISAATEVLKSGWLAHGPKTKEFEDNFAKYHGVKKAISFNSCTSALEVAIRALNLKGEIIVPSFTFVASANAIVTAGCKPVFIDIREDTRNMDEDLIESLITKDTVAIMPVHYAGQMCDMKRIMEIAKKHNLAVIEDSAECIGGTFEDGKSGSFGIGCFSFYPTKNITCGEGGMITTNDEELAKKMATIHAHGVDSSAFEREKQERPWIRSASIAGFNHRLTDIQSAIGNEQLKKLDALNEKRREHAHYLNEMLGKIKEIKVPVEAKECKHVYQMYTILLDKSINRSRFIAQLKEKGISASVHFDPPVHLQPVYSNMYDQKKLNLKVTEEIVETIVTLPMYPDMAKEQLDYMIKTIIEVLKNAKN